jgi:hypothetical protein
LLNRNNDEATIQIQHHFFINKLKLDIMITRGRVTKENLTKAVESGRVTHYENNPLFESMKNSILDILGGNQKFTAKKEECFHTCVGVKGGFRLTSSEAVLLEILDGSHARIVNIDKNVDISRIISNTKGLGTAMMLVIIDAYIRAKSKDIKGELILECLGSVGVGGGRIEMDIKEQTAFFRKFGFRVYKFTTSKVDMVLKMDNDDFENTVGRLKDLYKMI